MTHPLLSIHTDAEDPGNLVTALTYRRNVEGLISHFERTNHVTPAYIAQRKRVEAAVAEVLRTQHGIGPIGSQDARDALRVEVEALVAVAEGMQP